MPVSRSHLTRPKPRQVLVDLGEGDTLSIVFDANRITPAWMREAQERDEATDPLSLPTALAEVILRWDVTEEDGAEFAPTAANLAEFSYPVQSLLLTEILKAAVPSSEEGNASSDTSATASTDSASSQASLQNGQAPSLSEKPLESPQPR